MKIERSEKINKYFAGDVIRALFILVIMLMLGGCLGEESPSGTSGDAPQPITVCTSAVSPLQLPVWYAFEKGLFEEYNLQAELVGLPNGSTAATALIAGEVDACQIAASNIVNAAVAGEDLVLIGGLFDTHVYSLMVSPDITDAADLVGKSVAVTRPGTATETSLRMALQHLGLEPDDNVAIISAGSHGDIMGALTSGSVDGAIQGVPLSIQSRELGFHQLLDLSTLPIPYQHVAVATNRKFLHERPEDGLNLMRAVSHSVQQMQGDPDGTKAVLAKYLNLDLEADAELLEETYQIVVKHQLEPIPTISLEGVQAVIELAAKSNPNAVGFEVEKVIDLSIMEELENSGFLSSLKE